MAASAETIRRELEVVTAAAAAELAAEAAKTPLERQVDTMLAALEAVIPAYYDAAASLASTWYDQLRDESDPTTDYTARIIGDPATDWIEREAAKFRRQLEAPDLEAEIQSLNDEIVRLAGKEVARGYRTTIIGNTRQDQDAVGWSRIARSGACKFCLMLADKGAIFRAKSTAIFAAHTNCNCAAQPRFRNGDLGPEASVIQYVASEQRAKDDAAQAKRNALLREYLNEHYPDAPG